ncbi:hypothetical protein J437_LFUL014766 [Ladona fulva]|uniref:GH18 domain-containing protein n=1 Tax=Ladona fulva TaxID=123851 RepID=A0A8K0P5H3_LADFU|nr:hypothetical protein J437_LFUL014766 [Ladona fulva]
MADLLCEMKNEFDKYGYSLAISLVGAVEIEEESLDKIARCCDYIALLTLSRGKETHRIAPINMIKSTVDWYVERGIPARKILAIVPALGAIFTLEDPDDTGPGAKVNGPGNDDREMLGGHVIQNKEARYVLENGLGGIDIVAMEFEDDEGIGGEGRFPLTRTVYNTFRGGN